jgi:hypothetical protein
MARLAVYEAQKRGHSLFAFLSYTSSSDTSILSIMHSLIFQLAADDDNLQSIVCQSSGAEFRNNVEAAKKIFKTLLCCAGPVYIIIDGLDEIDASIRCRILALLFDLLPEFDEMRILISCRSEADLTNTLRERCTTIRIDELNHLGIQAYITQRSTDWYCNRAFPSDVRDEIKALLAPLASKAKGTRLF